MATRAKKSTSKPAPKRAPRIAPGKWLKELAQLRGGAEATLATINNEADLAETLQWVLPLVNSSPAMTRMFLTDTEAFCKDFGIELGPVIRRHLRQRVSLYKKRSPAHYEALKRGANGDPWLTSIRLRPTAELLRKATPLVLPKTTSVSADRIDRRLLASMVPSGLLLHPARVETGSPQSRLLAFRLTTSNWNVVVQVREDFLTSLYQLFFNVQFFVSFLVQAFGGPANTAAVDQNFEYVGWFLTFFRVRFTIAQAPTVRLSGTADTRIDMHIVGDVAFGSSGTTFGTAIPFEADTSQLGHIRGIGNGTVFGSPLSGYYSAANGAETDVEITSGPTTEFMVKLAVTGAVWAYFNREFQETFVLPTVENPPFLSYGQSDCFVAFDPDTGARAASLAFGPPAAPSPTMTTFMIPDGRNITIGLHRSVALQQIEKELPDLPATQGDITIDTMDVDLREGHVLVSGGGSQATCWCYPDIDFTYEVRVVLNFDGQGNLSATVSNVDVSSVWVDVHAFIVGLIIGGPLGGIVGAALGHILFDAVAGTVVAGNVQGQLNFSQNFDVLFSRQFGIGSITARFSDARITRNGIFLSGQIDAAFS